jgi:hypothetical protein
MGDNRTGFQQGYKQLNGARLHVLRASEYRDLKPTKSAKKRMESKALMWIFTSLFVGGYPIAILLNIGTWKSFLLFSVFFLWGVAKLVFYCIRQWQEYKLRQFDIKIKQRESEDEILPHQ